MPSTIVAFIERLRRFFRGSSRIAAPQAPFYAPADAFPLAGWKLQIPGPAEITLLDRYASRYFSLTAARRMRFWVNCSETGTSANSRYVRSELRHLHEWPVSTPLAQQISASLSVQASEPDVEITVLQIHGRASNGDSVPPLLRLYQRSNRLYAALKRNDAGHDTSHRPLASVTAGSVFECRLMVAHGHLAIQVNGREVMSEHIGYWRKTCHFKAGCYAQTNRGTAASEFRELTTQQGI
jgi:hypothetical protein